MRKSFLLFVASATSLLTLSATREAHALGPLDIEIAGKIGYGSNPDSGEGLNRLGFGLGGRAGLALFGIYAGVNIVDYLGGSATPPACPAGTPCPNTLTGSVHTLMYGGEFGFGFKISIVTIRPLIGVGSAIVSGPAGSASSLYLEPGVTGLVSFGLLFVGVDANVAIFPSTTNGEAASSSSTNEAFTIHGQVGVRF
jgi:hypothetical protein